MATSSDGMIRQRAIGTGGLLKIKRADASYEKPKKPIPKKKLTSKDMTSTWLNPKIESDGDEPEVQEEERFKSHTPVYTTDENLVDFLKQYDTEGDDRMDQARDYLLRGPPFKGTHDKQYKVSIKDIGLRWLKNPDFMEGEWGSGQRFGWYVAHDAKELKSVLTMPRKVDGERAWSPCDIDEVAMRFIDELMEKHNTAKLLKEEKAREESEARRKAKELAQGRGSGVREADLPHDIEAIRQYMAEGGYPDWEYDRELLATSSTCSALGPICHTHAIRVRRGLRFNIITPAQVVSGEWDSEEVVKKRKREEMRTSEIKRRADQVQFEDRQASKLKMLKAKAERSTRVLKRDDELDKEDTNDVVATEVPYYLPADLTYAMVDSSLKTTTCHDCDVILHEQFMDCMCIDRLWTKCQTCLVGYCDVQACACSTDDRVVVCRKLPSEGRQVDWHRL